MNKQIKCWDRGLCSVCGGDTVHLHSSADPSFQSENVLLMARVRELESLLCRVMPEEMGGYPDLFCPEGGWEQFQADASAALASPQRSA